MIAIEKLFKKRISGMSDLSLDFSTFKNIYLKHNDRLWRAYEREEITAQELKTLRFKNTLEELGIVNSGKEGELNHYYLEDLSKLPNLMPNAKKILEYLSPKYSLGILSNGFKNAQHSKMNHSGIIEYFEKIITSDQVGVNKPNPEIFKYAIEMSGVKVDEIAYIGDNYLVDTVPANEMGIKGILLDPNNLVFNKEIIKIQDLIELKKYF